MGRKIFVNLPIRNMERSQAFFRALGFSFNPQFTNEQGACMVIAEDESRAEVDDLVRKALAAGGTAPNAPQDHGFIYGHGFEDPDGHLWEVLWMDPAAAPPQP